MATDDNISVITDVSDMDDDNFVQIDSPDTSPYDEIFQSQYPQRQGQSGRRGSRRAMEAMEAYEEEAERICDHNKTAALIDLTTRALQRKVSSFGFGFLVQAFRRVLSGLSSQLAAASVSSSICICR